MNRMKTLEYSRKIFRVEILFQAMMLLIFSLSPVKLISPTTSTIYICVYILIYKVIIKKSKMKSLLLLNILLNIVPSIYFYFIICLKYEESLSNLGIPIFTVLTAISIFIAYKFVMSKAKLGLFAGIYLIPFITSQYMINHMEMYTNIMILYVLLVFLLVRYPLECFRMYKNKEEYIYY